MFNHCSELLDQGLTDKLIETLQLEKHQNQDLFNQLITMNDYHIFNRAMQLGSKNVIACILLAFDDHQALLSSQNFNIFSTLIDDKRYDILSIILDYINPNCRNVLFVKFGEFQMSLCHVNSGLIQYYRENKEYPFSYSQHVDIIKAAIITSNTKGKLNWLAQNFQQNTWEKSDVLVFLRIAIRFGNIDTVKLIETKDNHIYKELLQHEHSYALVEAGRHQKLFDYLINKLSPYPVELEHIFIADDYALLHEAVKQSNNSNILLRILNLLQTTTSRSLAISSRDNQLYQFAYFRENNELMEVLLSEQATINYAIRNFKCPKYDDTLPSTHHLRRLLIESHICLGQGEISKANVKSLLLTFDVDQKYHYFKLSIQHKNSKLLQPLYSSIRTEASQFLLSELKHEILEYNRLSLVKFLMEWNQHTALNLLEKDLVSYLNCSISNNFTELLIFLHENFPIQFKDFFKNLTNWQKVVSNFSVEVFKLLFKFMDVKDIEPILKQDNHILFCMILEKGLTQVNQWNSLVMLTKIIAEFPQLFPEMVTSRECVSAAIQARNAVAVRTLLNQDKTIFFKVIAQMFQHGKKEEIILLISLIQSDKHYWKKLDSTNPALLESKYHHEYKNICNQFSRKRPREHDLQSAPNLAH
jgi:hypothetical protein